MKPFHKEQLGKVRTKIVATVGPASSDPAVLRQMVEAGVDVFRLNFSHGTHEEHTAQLQAIRRIAEEAGLQIAVLQDLCGPKIRLGEIPGDVVACDHDAEFVLVAEPARRRSPSPDLHLPDAAGRPRGGPDRALRRRHGGDGGDRPRAGSGAAEGDAAGPDPVAPGDQRARGCLSVSALTDKDLADLEWTAAHDVAYVGLSFVRRAEDIIPLRRELECRGSRARIVAKIEKREALANLDAIIAEADAVMVARGDLGVELDVTRVPAVQKRIIAACHRRGCR